MVCDTIVTPGLSVTSTDNEIVPARSRIRLLITVPQSCTQDEEYVLVMKLTVVDRNSDCCPSKKLPMQ